METLMERGADLMGGLAVAGDWAMALLTYNSRVPDSVFFALCCVLIALSRRNVRETIAGLERRFSDVFRDELLRANRRTQSMRRELDDARLDIERDRQNKRRARLAEDRRLKESREAAEAA
jgi:hypothetical protein